MRVIAAITNLALVSFIGYLALRDDAPWRTQELVILVVTLVPTLVGLLAVWSKQPTPHLRNLAAILAGCLVVVGSYVLATEPNQLGPLEWVWATLHLAAPISTLLALYWESRNRYASGPVPN